jgi:hypothetical protein
MLFTNMRANCTVCSPSRAALLTGRFPDRVGVPGVIRAPQEALGCWGYFDPNVPTVADELKKAGYHTAMIGKWHLGLESPNTPNERGFDFFHGTLDGNFDSYTTHLHRGFNHLRRNAEVRLMALGRNEGKGNDTPMATSDDQGATWSEISGLAALPQSHSGICPLTLSDGTHICILNTPVNPKNPRDRLELMGSRDGVNWSLGLTLNPAGDGKVANYPQAVQTADGNLHIVFTYANQMNAQTWRERVIRHVVLATGIESRHVSPETSPDTKATPKPQP